MLRAPFFLLPSLDLTEAMKLVVRQHYLVYPICEADAPSSASCAGRRCSRSRRTRSARRPDGWSVSTKEERLSTPWVRSLRFRHPWLQLNLLTAFLAALVAGALQSTIDRIVILAVFLPVLASSAESPVRSSRCAVRKLGADPATASSIILTTATDVVSIGLFLGSRPP